MEVEPKATLFGGVRYVMLCNQTCC